MRGDYEVQEIEHYQYIHERHSMIKSIVIKNFKSLSDLSLKLYPMTVIIGDNASGKSSFLQAIDFLCCSVREDFENWLERRRLIVDDIRSRINPTDSPKFHIDIEIHDDAHCVHKYTWNLETHLQKEKNCVLLGYESVDVDGKNVFTYVNTKSAKERISDLSTLVFMEGMEIHSSYLKLIGPSSSIWQDIAPLKKFLSESNSFELLSPEDMRLSSRGSGNDIGPSGRNLPSFIGKMTMEQKSSYMKKIICILDGRISNVSTVSSRKAGWTKINTTEQFPDREIFVNSSDISDGTLRILALAAISEIKSGECVMLLDEIENGINTSYAKRVLDILEDMYESSGHQLLLTTHSTVFLDYVNPQNIIFLYRDNNGNTLGNSFSENEQMRHILKALYPGEIVLNLSQTELREKILGGNRG